MMHEPPGTYGVQYAVCKAWVWCPAMHDERTICRIELTAEHPLAIVALRAQESTPAESAEETAPMAKRGGRRQPPWEYAVGSGGAHVIFEHRAWIELSTDDTDRGFT